MNKRILFFLLILFLTKSHAQRSSFNMRMNSYLIDLYIPIPSDSVNQYIIQLSTNEKGGISSLKIIYELGDRYDSLVNDTLLKDLTIKDLPLSAEQQQPH